MIFPTPSLHSETLYNQNVPFEFFVLHFHSGDLNLLCLINTQSLCLVNKATFCHLALYYSWRGGLQQKEDSVQCQTLLSF